MPGRRKRSTAQLVGSPAVAGHTEIGEENQERRDGSPQDRPSPKRMHVDGLVATGIVEEEDMNALDCGVCFLPLKPPIFQCQVGHALCQQCRDALVTVARSSKCHVCGVVGEYHRCHAMERVVESVRVPCLNAAHGCTARPAYYDHLGHSLTCAHAPCHCPGEACGFVGSTEALVDHFVRVHDWPCPCITFKPGNGRKVEYTYVSLDDGFNFFRVDTDADSGWYLFLLKVVGQPLGRAISVLCIHHHAATAAGNGSAPCLKEMKCKLKYMSNLGRDVDMVTQHHQKSCFRVSRSDLSDGLPSPEGCFQFLVPDCVLLDKDKDTIIVAFQIDITSRQCRPLF